MKFLWQDAQIGFSLIHLPVPQTALWLFKDYFNDPLHNLNRVKISFFSPQCALTIIFKNPRGSRNSFLNNL